MTTNERLQAIEERYLGQGAAEFAAHNGDAEDYAAQVFAREIFGADVDPIAPDLGIHTSLDLADAIRELIERI